MNSLAGAGQGVTINIERHSINKSKRGNVKTPLLLRLMFDLQSYRAAETLTTKS